ncbi:MAG: amidohydrolase [Rhodospirillales bacterium]|nr:amidohydrolase [Rhodospirillales bacterium]
MNADLIFRDAKVITVDGDFRIAGAVAVRGAQIAAVGAEGDVMDLAGPDTRIIDCEGRAVIPGLIDGHAHMDREGLKEALPSLSGCRSVDDIVERVGALAARAKPGDWIVTMPVGEPPTYDGVPETLTDKRFPDRWDLDRAAPDNPVYIRSIWGPWRHRPPLVSIANSPALALAGITRHTPSPAPSIEIEKEPESGEPTGRLIETNLLPIIEHALMGVAPRFTLVQRVAGLTRSMEIYNSFATTSVFEGHGVAAEVLDAYKAVRRADAQTVRAHLVFSPSWRAAGAAEVNALLETWGGWLADAGLGDDWLRVSCLFAEVDESPEAALRAQSLPHTGWAGFYPDHGMAREQTLEMMVAAARAGIRVAGVKPHLLDLYEEVDRQVPLAGRRWVLGHINILNGHDIERAQRLGLVMTTHTNRYIFKEGEAAAGRLGKAGADQIVPLAALSRAGVPFALASDNMPVSLFHPLWQAVARKGREAGTVVSPDQRLSREEALRAATMGGAALTFEEGVKGSIEVGKLADFAVLSDDPLTCPEDVIKDIVAETTVVGGRVVYER